MSRLTDLLRRVELHDPAMAKELEGEVKTLSARRAFGLSFERHVPETVELSGRLVRRGDKVRVLAPRAGQETSRDDKLWLVHRVEGNSETRSAHLVEFGSEGKPAETQRPVADLVVVAEFRDPIYPGLRSTGKVERGGDKPFHTVINGENYHALEALLLAHQGQIDCIYIDPPYNTRDKDWKYNNDYVDSDDAYRHSKWLAMMERRLKLAKRLLNPKGSVLIVTIDEKEYLRLGMLLEQVFPSNRIQMISTAINPSGVARGKEFYRVDEYIYFVYIGSAVVTDARVDGLCITESEAAAEEGGAIEDAPKPNVRWESLLRSGTGARRQESSLKFYPVLVDVEREMIHGPGEILAESEHPEDYTAPDGLVPVWPIRQDASEGRWQLSRKTFQALLRDGHVKIGNITKRAGEVTKITILYLPTGLRAKIGTGEVVVVGKDKYGGLALEYSGSHSVSGRPKTQWNAKSHSATDHGSSLLRKVVPGRKFPFPKSLYAVEDTLRFFIADNPNGVVLDFFAGSGTTAHAVMRLNRQDGGQRRSIMVTNNEVSNEEARALRAQGHRPGDPEWEALGICEYVTKPRVRAAITGQRPDGTPITGDYKFTDEFPMAEGFEENAEFFDLTYEDPERVRHDLAFRAIAPLLWMKAGSVGRRIEMPADGYDMADTYGVLFNLDVASDFVQAVTCCERVQFAYIVTDDEKQFQIIAHELPRRVQPQRLYESYLGTFRITGED